MRSATSCRRDKVLCTTLSLAVVISRQISVAPLSRRQFACQCFKGMEPGWRRLKGKTKGRFQTARPPVLGSAHLARDVEDVATALRIAFEVFHLDPLWASSATLLSKHDYRSLGALLRDSGGTEHGRRASQSTPMYSDPMKACLRACRSRAIGIFALASQNPS